METPKAKSQCRVGASPGWALMVPVRVDESLMWMRRDSTWFDPFKFSLLMFVVCGACWTFPCRYWKPNTGIGFWKEEPELSQEAKASETRAKLEDYAPWKIQVHGPAFAAFASLIGEIEFSEIILNFILDSRHFHFAYSHTATSQQSLPGLATCV